MLLPAVIITFEEPDITARIPACVPIVAAVLAAGFRTVDTDEAPNHQDVLTGARYLTDFKGLSRSRAGRTIGFRFRTGERNIEGQRIGAQKFVELCRTDAAFFRTACAHPKWEHWKNFLSRVLPDRWALSPNEHDDYGRQLIVPAFGSADLKRILHDKYQTSWA